MEKEELLYLCRCLNMLTKLPINLYSSSTEEIEEIYRPFYQIADEEMDKKLFRKYLIDIFKNNPDSSIAYYISDDMLGFGIVRDTASEWCAYIGPCKFVDIDKKTALRMFKDETETAPSSDDLEKLHKYLQSLSKIMPETLMTILSFLNVSINHEILKPVTFFSGSPMFKTDNQVLDTLIEKMEFNGLDENGVKMNEAEKELVALVQSGNLQELKKYWATATSLPTQTSSVHHHDMLRHEKNTFIETITVISRAAISAGVNPNFAHTLKDTYILRCENVTDVKGMHNLYPAMLNSFTVSVNDVLNSNPSGNYIVSRAVSYISNHITEKISAKDICKALNISQGYLSTVFKNANNISIPEYVNQQKINVSKGLLLNTEKTLTEIANYLSFSSQSYFQSQFKKFEGLTPTEFKAKALKRNK